MKNKKEWIIITILSITYFILFPINLHTTASPYWIFILWSYLFYILFWLLPIIYIYRKNKRSYYKYLLILNIIFICIFLYFATNYSKYNQELIREKILKIETIKNLK